MFISRHSLMYFTTFATLLIGRLDGVVNFLPGVGEEVGPELIGSPDVNLIAFTGSRSVGLAINHEASKPDDNRANVDRLLNALKSKA